jgi:DnaJ-class molecular chaperone
MSGFSNQDLSDLGIEEDQTCPACGGDGGVDGRKCYACKGTGSIPGFTSRCTMPSNEPISKERV